MQGKYKDAYNVTMGVEIIYCRPAATCYAAAMTEPMPNWSRYAMHPEKQNQPEFVTIADARKLFGIPRSTLYELEKLRKRTIRPFKKTRKTTWQSARGLRERALIPRAMRSCPA